MISDKPPELLLKRDISIRKLLFRINLVFLLFFFLTVAAVSIFFIFPEYYRYEYSKIKEEVIQLENMLSGEIANLDLYCRDWALWTDTWHFIQDENSEYIESNLGAESLHIGNLSFFIFINGEGDIIYAGWLDPQDNTYRDDIGGVEPFELQPLIYREKEDYSERVRTGIVRSSDGRYLFVFSSRNILKSDISGPAAGTLIAGRIIGDEMLSKLSAVFRHEIRIAEEVSEDSRKMNTGNGGSFYLDRLSLKEQRFWRIFIPLELSIRGSGIYLVYEHKISIINQGIRMVILISLIILVSFILLLAMQQIWIIRAVILPITNLNGYIEKQSSTIGGGYIHGNEPGNEISRLSSSFHFLFNRLFEQNRQLFSRANTDALTGLSRRNVVLELLKDLCSINEAGMVSPFCIFMIDIDFFKKINDSYGHLKGDEVLSRTAGLIKSCLRDRDTIGRYGGEEFVAVIQDVPFGRIRSLAERVRETVEAQEWSFKGRVTISIGYYFGGEPFNAERIIEAADSYLYKAKNRGRNRVEGPNPPADDSDQA